MQFFLLIAKFSVRPYGTKPTQNVRGTVRMEFSVRQYGTKPTQNVRGTVRIKFSGCQYGTKPTQNVRGTVRIKFSGRKYKTYTKLTWDREKADFVCSSSGIQELAFLPGPPDREYVSVAHSTLPAIYKKMPMLIGEE